MTKPTVFGPNGRPISSRTIARVRELAGGAGGRPRQMGGLNLGPAGQWFPYDAADIVGRDIGDWLPWIRSPDHEIDYYRDRITARARDLYRNDPWAQGAIGRILDSTIGGSYRLIAQPDWQALRARYGKGFDKDWAEEFKAAIQPRWRAYAGDVDRWGDVTRELTVSQQFRLALGHKLVDGESLIVSYWMPDRVGPGAARYATAFLGVDPDRLSNPYQMVDTAHMRNGVELDDDGVPVAYHVRKAHQFDWYNAVESMEWERIEAEDPDGWRRVIHDFDRQRFQQHRGVSIFAPVIKPLRMLAKYYGVELKAATVASALGLFARSPFDADMIRNALEGDDAEQDALGWYQEARGEFHRDRANELTVDDVKVPTLFPGEDIVTVNPTRPNSAFSPFTHEILRSFGQVLGISAEQTHNDYSEASWSSARAGIVEAEKTFVRRTQDFNTNTADRAYACWLEEPFDLREVPLPAGAPPYREARTEYSGAKWLGAARGWVDPVAERQGAILGLDAGFSTLEIEVAKQGGDWREYAYQRAEERDLFEKLGLPFPDWFGKGVAEGPDAQQVSQKPTAV